MGLYQSPCERRKKRDLKTLRRLPSTLRNWELSPIPRHQNTGEPCNKCRRLQRYADAVPSPSSQYSQDKSYDFEPLPLVEIKERSVLRAGRSRSSMYQDYKGQLRVAVYINYGLLTVHVMEAKDLASKRSKSCDPFVKVSLIPGEDERSRCQTDTIYDTSDPLFDEKFSFELLDEDIRKRLSISVWHQDPQARKHELLGCMSFGVKHIYSMKRTVNGWYFLLSEEIGKGKHLRSRHKSRPEAIKEPSTDQNKTLLWMDPHTVVMKKRDCGYGFTFGGWNPAQVIRVEPDSAAECSGLQVGDWIIHINGVNVTGSSPDSIARIIRHCPPYLVLDVHRPRQIDTLEASPVKSHKDSFSSQNSGQSELGVCAGRHAAVNSTKHSQEGVSLKPTTTHHKHSQERDSLKPTNPHHKHSQERDSWKPTKPQQRHSQERDSWKPVNTQHKHRPRYLESAIF